MAEYKELYAAHHIHQIIVMIVENPTAEYCPGLYYYGPDRLCKFCIYFEDEHEYCRLHQINVCWLSTCPRWIYWRLFIGPIQNQTGGKSNEILAGNDIAGDWGGSRYSGG